MAGGGERTTERLLRAGLGEVVLLVPGAELRSAPREDGEVLERVERLARLGVLEHDGRWVRVRRPAGGSAWVDPNLEPGSPPPLGMAPVAPLPLPGHPPPPERLAEARRLMGASAREGRLGPYLLLSDVSDEVLELHLDRLASSAAETYASRYGLEPVGDAAEAVVLFRRESAYRQFQASLPLLAGVAAQGHASLGVASLFQGPRSRLEVGLTLLHELGHLLNRRSLGPALPPWLDEGLAEDFSHWAVAGGGFDPYTRFRREVERAVHEHEVQMVGPLAALQMVSDDAARGLLGSPHQLLELDWASFATGEQAALRYAHAALWIGFLDHGAGGRYRSGWRAYLDGVRRGEAAEPEALRGHLEASWEELAGQFATWVENEAASAGLRGETASVTNAR